MKWKCILPAFLATLLPTACLAAFAIFQTHAGQSQIHYNIVTDGGANCNDNHVVVTRNITTSNGNTNLQVSVDTFTSGDVGKRIIVPGAGFAGGTISTTITAFVNAQNVTMGQIAQTNLSGVSTSITYGTDDAPNFKTFNTWARANQGAFNQVVLTIPAGSNCWFGSAQSITGVTLTNAWPAGINNLIVEGTGATINSTDGSGFHLGGQGIIQVGLTQANGQSARVQSVSPGATQVTLTSASFSAGYISRFTAGRWLMIGGVDPQGLWQGAYGFPPNARYFEWRQITNVNTGTGTITLDRPLTKMYLDTWPNWNTGNGFEVDQGGPATIYVLNDTWNQTVEYRGLTINQGGQTYAVSRHVTYRDVTFGGFLGGIPTQNETWTAINTTWQTGTVLETDKLVGTMTMDNVYLPRIDFQSSSTDLFILRNSTIPNALIGTPTRTEITDTTIAFFRPGATGYGQSVSTVCTRCNITLFDFDGGVLTPQGGSPFYLSMSGGVLAFPNVNQNGPYPTGIEFIPPNGNVFWSGGGYLSIGLFNVLALTQDPYPPSDNQIVTTDVTIASGTKLLGVSTPIFASGDVGKVIYIPNARSGPAQLNTVITAFTDAQNVTVQDNATNSLVASSQQLQWGTSNTYVQTNEAGGMPGISGGITGLRTHPSPQWTCTDPDPASDPTFIASCTNSGATPEAPLGSYGSRSYAPTSAQGNIGKIEARGKLVSLTVDVTQAYSGSGSATLNATAQFNNQGTVKQSDWTNWAWGPQINLKQTGTRVITPGGVTCNGVAGGCAGDTINSTNGFPSEAIWIPNEINPYMGSTLGAGDQPQFTMTIVTDPVP